MSDFEVRGSQEMATVARRLKEAGRTDLRKELLAGVRTAASKAIPDIRTTARATLPRGGGLAELVASQPYSVRTSPAVSGAKVSIIVRGGMKEIQDIDQGRLLHPVYGDRSNWVEQSVTPGFVSATMAAQAGATRDEVEGAMDKVAHEITSGL